MNGEKKTCQIEVEPIDVDSWRWSSEYKVEAISIVTIAKSFLTKFLHSSSSIRDWSS